MSNLFHEAEQIYRHGYIRVTITGKRKATVTKGEALARAIEARFDKINMRLQQIERTLKSFSTQDE
jgi:hypothetical protein